MRRSQKIFSLILSAIFISVLTLNYQVNNFMDKPLNIADSEIPFEIITGTSFSSISDKLVKKELIDNDYLLHIYARWHGLTGKLQAGEYLITIGTTPKSLLDQFINGSVRLYTFTLIEGWNYREVLQALHTNEAVEATLTHENWPSFLVSQGSEITHPEGLFLPETYRFPRNTTDRELLRQAYQLMQSVIANEWEHRQGDLQVKSPYEALILASIVEKETARIDERAKIAGVFTRRLEKRMRLQTDPTVIYGIGPSFNGNLTRENMKTDTPYNTYTRHGLPPTPIAMPGRAAINAVLHPEIGEELYFVATGLDDGSHKFSITKKEHDKAVAEYLFRFRLREKRQSGK